MRMFNGPPGCISCTGPVIEREIGIELLPFWKLLTYSLKKPVSVRSHCLAVFLRKFVALSVQVTQF